MAERRARLWRACALAAAAASLAGCVSMPATGPVNVFSASPQGTAPADNVIGPVPSGPQAGWSPPKIVRGFLTASASYPTAAAIAREYLVSSISKTWDPGWSVHVFSDMNVPDQAAGVTRADRGAAQALVTVTGDVQATFNGTGEYVSAPQSSVKPTGQYQFHLVKVDGQWRISNPPNYWMLTGTDFSRVYQAQDLYFFDSQQQVLVPDSVFVPVGTLETLLVKNLVEALIQGPKSTWLQDATSTAFPAGTTILGVPLSGDVAVVNLGGSVTHASQEVLQLIAAQLVWTLVGAQGSQTGIQSVELELNGKAVTSVGSPCGGGQGQSPVQKLSAYECYNPYPAAPASFYYVNGGQAWSRCGDESKVLTGLIGQVIAVTGRGAAQQCGAGFVPYQSGKAPQAPQPWLPALSMVAVSPDGKYLAGVSAARDTVYIRALAGGASSSSRLGSGVSALSWDRGDNLWVAQAGGISVLSASGKEAHSVSFPGDVTDLSVAPDGVRIALVVRQGSVRQVQLAAINRGVPSNAQLRVPLQRVTIGQVVQLGANVANPMALTWYDADYLIVLNAGSRLWQVPVDGQQATGPRLAPPGTISITADGAANALVAELSGRNLEVSASLDGPWQPLALHGQSPAYPG